MKSTFLTLFFLLSLNCWSQDHLKRANELYDRLVYIEAAKEYEAYLKEAQSIDPETWMRVGDTYYNLKDYIQAKEAYEKWYNMVGPNKDNSQGYKYYDALRRLKQYEKAYQISERYFKAKREPEALNAHYEERARFAEILQADTLYEVKNLPINSQYADFGGSIYEDLFVFTSARNKDENKIYERDNTPYLSLFKIRVAEVKGNLSPVLFNAKLETPYHDGTATFTRDGRYMYYASSFQNGRKKIFETDKRNYFKIYRVDLTDQKLKKELLPINGDDYSTGQPFITKDGKKLFFASDMPGGYGKADIYVCDVYEDGTFSKPMNLGPQINTIVDDFFPFFKENTLYFSSGGHVGFGGLDIYKSYFKDGLFGTAVNLGPVINTNADDFAYIEGEEPNTGFISSDRAGGQGDDDIYSFKYNVAECLQYLSGSVYELETKKPLEGVTVIAYKEDGSMYSRTTTTSDGAYSLDLFCNETYRIKAKKIGYSEDELNFTTDVLPGRKMDRIDFNLKDLSALFVTEGDVEKIRIEPIYFEYYRYNINSIAAIQLQKILDVMNAYPEMVIKIESHTDQRGTDYSNKILSTKRALATRDWLISKGIDANRIESAIGYGESRPINICDEGENGCSEVEYSENRRSEFIVVRR